MFQHVYSNNFTRRLLHTTPTPCTWRIKHSYPLFIAELYLFGVKGGYKTCGRANVVKHNDSHCDVVGSHEHDDHITQKI